MTTIPYTIIKSSDQYANYCAKLERIVLSDRPEQHEDEIELLSLLIRTWDDENLQNQHLDPVELVVFLLKENDLSQSDLARIIGRSRSYVSEILSYKKRFSSEVIRKISEHFKIQQSALNRDYPLKNSKPSTEKQSLMQV